MRRIVNLLLLHAQSTRPIMMKLSIKVDENLELYQNVDKILAGVYAGCN